MRVCIVRGYEMAFVTYSTYTTSAMRRMLMQLFCCTVISATAMTLRYPRYPQNNMTLRLRWAGGIPPVRYLLHTQ